MRRTIEVSNVISRIDERAACIAVVGGDESGKTTYVKHLLNMLTIKHAVVVVPNQDVADEYQDMEKVEHIIDTSCCGKLIEQVSALKRDCRAVQMAINNTQRYVEFDTRVALVFDNMDYKLEDIKAWFGEFLASCQFANITTIVTLESPRILSPFARTQIDYAVTSVDKFSWVIYNVLEADANADAPVTADAPKQTEVFDDPVPVTRNDGTPEGPDPKAEKWTEMMADPTNVAIIGERSAGKTSMAIRLIRHTPVHYNRVVVWGNKFADHPKYRPYTHMLLEDFSVEELAQIFERLWTTQQKHEGRLRTLLVIDRPLNFIRESVALAKWIEQFIVYGNQLGLSTILCLDNVRDVSPLMRANIERTLVVPRGADSYSWAVHDGLGDHVVCSSSSSSSSSSSCDEKEEGDQKEKEEEEAASAPYDVTVWKGIFENSAPFNLGIFGLRCMGKTTLAGQLVEQAKAAGYKRVVWIPTHEQAYVPMTVEPHQVRRDIGSKEFEGFIGTLVHAQQQQLGHTEKLLLVIDSKIELFSRKAQVQLRWLLLHNRFMNTTVILTVDSPKLLALQLREQLDHVLVHPTRSAKYSWEHKIGWSDEVSSLCDCKVLTGQFSNPRVTKMTEELAAVAAAVAH